MDGTNFVGARFISPIADLSALAGCYDVPMNLLISIIVPVACHHIRYNSLHPIIAPIAEE